MPPYGDVPMAPILFAPYGEYVEAFRFTAVERVEGRSGMAGAPEVDTDVADKVDVDGKEAPLVTLEVAAPPRSHGFGGDGVDIV